MQELAPDAVVERDAAGNILHVGAHLLGEIGDLVDEGDLRREEPVGRLFDQFRRAPVGEQDRRAVEIKRAVDFAHDFARERAIGADNNARGA
jgi:hypothetical protein